MPRMRGCVCVCVSVRLYMGLCMHTVRIHTHTCIQRIPLTFAFNLTSLNPKPAPTENNRKASNPNYMGVPNVSTDPESKNPSGMQDLEYPLVVQFLLSQR